jgi:hypothetical protein
MVAERLIPFEDYRGTFNSRLGYLYQVRYIRCCLLECFTWLAFAIDVRSCGSEQVSFAANKAIDRKLSFKTLIQLLINRPIPMVPIELVVEDG